MSDVYIAAIGVASAQGCAARLASRGPVLVPRPTPYGHALCRPALDIPTELSGAARWSALARAAIDECLAGADVAADLPLVIGSCNGAADTLDATAWSAAFDTAALLDKTPWQGARIPVASASCASGMHALFLAACAVRSTGRDAVVLAVDILSRASHCNFDTLRVLSPGVDAPWTAGNRGFIQGEAAVAMRLTATQTGHVLYGPLLGSYDLGELVAAARAPSMILAQGTGPHAADASELAALGAIDRSIPLATAAHCFGHTLGVSGLLSIALACLGATDPYLNMPVATATDGRTLLDGSRPHDRRALIACRALDGACAIAGVGVELDANPSWPPTAYAETSSQSQLSAIHTPLIRNLAAGALAHRPESPPGALVVRLDAPLQPPDRARIGGRLLPTAVLEMTPGALPMTIANRWGYRGPALCLVGGAPDGPDSAATLPSITAIDDLTCKTCVVYVQGIGSNRDLQWRTYRGHTAAAG